MSILGVVNQYLQRYRQNHQGDPSLAPEERAARERDALEVCVTALHEAAARGMVQGEGLLRQEELAGYDALARAQLAERIERTYLPRLQPRNRRPERTETER